MDDAANNTDQTTFDAATTAAAVALAATLPDASKGWGLESFPLNNPFTLAGETFKSLVMRVPTGADIEAYVRSPERSFRVLALKLVTADANVLDVMHGADYSRLMAKVGKYITGAD